MMESDAAQMLFMETKMSKYNVIQKNTNDEDEYHEARTAIEKLCLAYTSDSPKNRAADLARRLEGKLPLI